MLRYRYKVPIPEMIRCRFFFFLTNMLWVQKKVPVDDLKLQGQIPLFQLCRGKKDESGQGDIKLGP
jgi:hypothetical protein